MRTALLTIAAAKGIALSKTAEARVAACSDGELLTGWGARAAVVSTEAEGFAGADAD